MPKTLDESPRKTPVVEDVDVLVAGGGPAGVCAAIAAARQGASTRLIDANGCVGGIWTTCLLSFIHDHKGKDGVLKDIVETLKARDVCYLVEGGNKAYCADVEQVKLVLEELCVEAGVRMLYHTRVVNAAVSEDRITHAIVENKSGRQAYAAKVFIDCTGDGDLAALAGCDFDLGTGPEHDTQPMSLIALAAGADSKKIAPFVRGLAEPIGEHARRNFLAEIKRAGIEPSYKGPMMYMYREGLYGLMINHQYGACGLNAQEVTAATLEARAEINVIVNGLRQLGEPWANFRLLATGAQIGVREGRRIHGLYTVNTDDLRTGKMHEDGGVQIYFPIDVHQMKADAQNKIERFKIQPYQIPYRAQIAKDVRNLLLAGRCISGDFIAHSSYRQSGDAAGMGEVAGRAAALAASTDRMPRDLPWSEVGATGTGKP